MSKLTYSGQKYFYAVLGAGELMIEKTKELAKKSMHLADERRKDAVKLYGEMAERGEKLTGKVKKSQPAKRVAENAKQAQRQLKGAVTSVRKALVAEPATSTAKSTAKKAS